MSLGGIHNYVYRCALNSIDITQVVCNVVCQFGTSLNHSLLAAVTPCMYVESTLPLYAVRHPPESRVMQEKPKITRR